MGETYAEAGVTRLANAKTYLIKAGCILLALLAMFLTFAITPSFFTIFVLICIGMGFLFPRLNIEYEYVYCDGQIDFDRISGKAKRKRMLRIDLEQVEIVAPVTSHDLDSYKNNNNYKLRDFTSLKKDAKPYAAYYINGEKRYKVLFEPNEKMLECMRYKAPRKVKTY